MDVHVHGSETRVHVMVNLLSSVKMSIMMDYMCKHDVRCTLGSSLCFSCNIPLRYGCLLCLLWLSWVFKTHRKVAVLWASGVNVSMIVLFEPNQYILIMAGLIQLQTKPSARRGESSQRSRNMKLKKPLSYLTLIRIRRLTTMNSR